MNMKVSIGSIVAGLLKKAIKESGKTRFEIAAEMSLVTGTTITKAVIDSWTSTARENWRFPFEYAPAFEYTTGSTLLSEFVTSLAGGKALFGDEAELVEIVHIQIKINQLEAEKNSLICDRNKQA